MVTLPYSPTRNRIIPPISSQIPIPEWQGTSTRNGVIFKPIPSTPKPSWSSGGSGGGSSGGETTTEPIPEVDVPKPSPTDTRGQSVYNQVKENLAKGVLPENAFQGVPFSEQGYYASKYLGQNKLNTSTGMYYTPKENIEQPQLLMSFPEQSPFSFSEYAKLYGKPIQKSYTLKDVNWEGNYQVGKIQLSDYLNQKIAKGLNYITNPINKKIESAYMRQDVKDFLLKPRTFDYTALIKFAVFDPSLLSSFIRNQGAIVSSKIAQGNIIKEGQTIRVPVTDSQGNNFIVEMPYSKGMKTLTSKELLQGKAILPEEELNLLRYRTTIRPKLIGQEKGNIANFLVKQEVNPIYAIKQQGKIADLIFNREQTIISKGKTIYAKNINPMLISQEGNILNNVLVGSGKIGGAKTFGRLSGRTIQIENFNQLPNNVQRQYLKQFEEQFGRPISKKVFADVYKNMENKFSVSEVEYNKLVTASRRGLKYAKVGRTTTRTSLADMNKLLFSTPEYEIYGGKTSIRDITFPKIKASSQGLNKMTGMSKVYKNIMEETSDIGNILVKKQLKVLKPSQKVLRTTQTSVKAVADTLVKPSMPKQIAKTSLGRTTQKGIPSMTSTLVSRELLISNQELRSQQRQQPRLTQRGLQIESLSESLVNRQPQKLKPRLTQREETPQRQQPRLTQTESIAQTLVQIQRQPPRTLRPTIPQISTRAKPPRTSLPIFPISILVKRKQIIKTTQKAVKGKSRRYVREPTITQVLFNPRVKRTKLSEATGFNLKF